MGCRWPGRSETFRLSRTYSRVDCEYCKFHSRDSMRIRLGLVVVCLLAAGCGMSAQAPAADDVVKSHYAKYEYRIPMRDGVKLFASVYVPQVGAFKDAGPYPFLMTRTPYSCAPYGEDKFPARVGPSQELMESGYIFVCEDARGRTASEGAFQEMSPHIDEKKSAKDVDESTDTYDTVEFLLKHVPNNNGKVGITGISYPGFYTSASIIDSHPAIKAASPQAPMTDLFMTDDAYHGGAFMLAANFGFYTGFKPQENPQLPPKTFVPFDYRTKDGYEFYLNAGPIGNLSKYLEGKSALFDDQMRHNTYDDYWKARNLAPHLKNIHCAVLTVGGWFDAEDLQGPFSTFHAIDKNNSGIFNGLVIGPWVHGGWGFYDGERLGRVKFGFNTGEYYRKNILFPFFEQYLKGNSDAKLPKAYVFETGTNVWRRYSAWPPKEAESNTLYFLAGGGLSFDPPASPSPAYDEYISDPAKPVPFVNYVEISVPQEYMVSDQRFASSRTDVLVYQTPVLEEDVTIAGPVLPRLLFRPQVPI